MTLTLLIQCRRLGRHWSRNRRFRRHLEYWELAVVLALAARDGRQLLRALDLLELDVWVVRIEEPVEAPLATCPQRRGQLRAVIPIRDATVLGARAAAVLGHAAREDALAAARNLQVEMVARQVGARVE